MNISFWNRVSLNWQSLKEEASEGIIDLELFKRSLMQDIDLLNNISKVEEYESEIEEDFWGGL